MFIVAPSNQSPDIATLPRVDFARTTRFRIVDFTYLSDLFLQPQPSTFACLAKHQVSFAMPSILALKYGALAEHHLDMATDGSELCATWVCGSLQLHLIPRSICADLNRHVQECLISFACFSEVCFLSLLHKLCISLELILQFPLLWLACILSFSKLASTIMLECWPKSEENGTEL